MGSIYRNNKLYIKILLGFCIMAGMFLFGGSGDGSALAAGLGNKQLTAFGGTLVLSIQTFATVNGIAIEPSITLLFVTILSILAEHGIWPAGLAVPEFGLLNFWWARIVVIVWALVSILSKCFQATATIGDTLEYINSKYVGPIAIVIIMVSSVLVDPSAAAGNVAYAATDGMVTVSSDIPNGWKIVIFIVGSILLLVYYAIIRFVLFAVDIALIPINLFVPLSSATCTFIKILAVMGSFVLAVVAPGVYLVLAALLFIICLLCIKVAYRVLVYYKNIYLKPFFKKLFGKCKEPQPMVSDKLPLKLREYIGEEIVLALPVYADRRTKYYPEICAKEKWWLITTPYRTALYRNATRKKHIMMIPIYDAEHRNPVYLNRSWFYYEILKFPDPTERKRVYAFYLSKEYKVQEEEIYRITGLWRRDKKKWNR